MPPPSFEIAVVTSRCAWFAGDLVLSGGFDVFNGTFTDMSRYASFPEDDDTWKFHFDEAGIATGTQIGNAHIQCLDLP